MWWDGRHLKSVGVGKGSRICLERHRLGRKDSNEMWLEKMH